MGTSSLVLTKQKPAILGLLFDMDGVLFDTERDSVKAIIRIASEMGFTIPEDFIIQNFGRNMAEESIIYRNYLGPDFDAEEFWKRYWIDRNDRYRDGPPIKEGAIELLTFANQKNVPCALASSSPTEEVRLSLRRVGIEPLFKSVIGGDMFEHSKPEPDIFIVAAQSLGLKAENCLVIEDSLNGLKSGRTSGAQVAFVRDVPDYPRDVLLQYSDYQFVSAREIIPLL